MPSNSRRPAPVPDSAVYISVTQVCARYGGRSHMWIERRLLKDPTFPRHKKIGGWRFFKISELEEYERACAANRVAEVA